MSQGQPFFFWYGGHEPHRAYEFQAGVNKGGKDLLDIDEVFEFWPDNDTIRHDLGRQDDKGYSNLTIEKYELSN